MQNHTSRTDRKTVLEAALELQEAGTPITPRTLKDWTGLRPSIINDHIKQLHFDGALERVERGVYAVVKAPPPLRPLSLTAVAGGGVLLEVGDSVVDLQPGELQSLRFLLSGIGTVPRQS